MNKVFMFKKTNYRCLSVILFAVITSLSATPAISQEQEQERTRVPEPGRLERAVARMVALRISNLHISRKRLNDEIGAKAFEKYFEQLDYNRYYFLKSDIEDFASYRKVLDDLVQEGDISFAYDVYARFLQRAEQRVDYVRRRLKKPFDFSGNDRFVVDREDAAWAKNSAELDDLWEKRLKNELLMYKLMEQKNEASADNGQDEQDRDDAPTKTDDDEAGTAPKQRSVPEHTDSGKKANSNSGSNTNDIASQKGRKIMQDIFAQKSPEDRVRESYQRYLRRVRTRNPMEVLEIFLSSLTHVYDPHSSYMAPDTEEDFDIQMNLSLQGIGAQLTIDNGYVKVTDIIPGGPAAKDGRLNAGDRIIAVAQEKEKPVDVVNMPLRKVVDRIRGEKGTKVYLTVVQAEKGMGSVPVVLDLTRDEVKLKSREAKAEVIELPLLQEEPASVATEDISDKAGAEEQQDTINGQARILVIRLPSFYRNFDADNAGDENFKSSTDDVKKLIEKHTENEEIDAMVLDLRSNGGGSLKDAIGVTGLFIPKGPVVQVRYSNGKKRILKDKDDDLYFQQPLVVMVNRLSASASEIVAGALKDYNRAVVVGAEKTHGKGTVQTVQHLEKAFSHAPGFKNVKPGSLKFTMAKFYRITGSSTQRKGVSPHIVFPSFRRHMELGEECLPHALPWDTIDPVGIDIDAVSEINVEPMIDELKRRSQRRRELSPVYKNWMSLVRQMGEQQKQNWIPLGLAERRKQQQEKEALSKKIRSYTQHRSALLETDSEQTGDRPEGEDVEKIDLILREGLQVARDLAYLEQGKKLGEIKETSPGIRAVYVKSSAGEKASSAVE